MSSRQEQRNIINSQNITWRNDNSKFGKVMLERMGWKPGRGLGKYEQGITENLQVKANILTKGLGCSERNDEVWLAHHDSFAAILADLNKKKEMSKAEQVKEKLETKQVKKSLKKMKSKTILNEHRRDRYLPNLSMMSEKDKCAIFGKRSTRRTVDKGTEENTQKDEIKSESSSKNIIVNKISINDYFSEKMRKLNEKRKV